MIEGIKVQVKGDELKRLLSTRLTEIKAKHSKLTATVEAIKKAAAEFDEATGESGAESAESSTSNNPKAAVRDKIKVYAYLIEELAFIFDHTDPAETFLLDREDLAWLGVGRDPYHY